MELYEIVLTGVFFVILITICSFLTILYVKGPTDLLQKYIYGTYQAARTPAKSFHHVDRKCNILLLGDSVAVGVGADSPEQGVGGKLFSNTRCNVDNFGVSGHKIHNIPNQIPKHTVKYDAVVIIVGANDFALSESYLTKDVVFNMVDRTLTLLRARFPKPIPILWATYVHPPIIPTLATNLLKDAHLMGWKTGMVFKEMLETLAPRYSINVENFKDVTYLPSQFSSADGVHPSNMGYELLAKYIIRGIQ